VGLVRWFGGVYAGVPNCSETLLPGVAPNGSCSFFSARALSLVLPALGYGLLMSDLGFSFLTRPKSGIWPWPFFSANIFSRLSSAFSVRPARLSVSKLLFSAVQSSDASCACVTHDKYPRHDRDQTFLHIHFSPSVQCRFRRGLSTNPSRTHDWQRRGFALLKFAVLAISVLPYCFHPLENSRSTRAETGDHRP